MIDKRLIRAVPGSMRLALTSVALQWVSLVANIAMILSFCMLLQGVYEHTASEGELLWTAFVVLVALIVRAACALAVAHVGYKASRGAKSTLRNLIFNKLMSLGSSYRDHAATSELVQVAVEGVDQLEAYFASYLPQFFYALLAPVTLFIVMTQIDVPAGVVLLVCVPLIPIAIMAVQTWAKKLLSKYWGRYTELGDTFLENLQGLTTLKVYKTDDYKQEQMNEQAEQFRRITMRVLTMQLNSISIMDLVAYGGAAAGIAVALMRFQAGVLDVASMLAIILLGADYFIPMRQLGSFFHIAMNGMAAADKIFNLLEVDEPQQGSAVPSYENTSIELEGVSFTYDRAKHAALQDVSMHMPQGSFTALVGKSGCGKSTLASLLMGRNRGYSGRVTLGGVSLDEITEPELFAYVTYVGHQEYLFTGTVRDNLCMAAPEARDEDLWSALEAVRLDGLFREGEGLDTAIAERGSNLSGGQRQRLAIARALLHNTPVYIFDEATSNIDAESEDAIMQVVYSLAATKTVLLISHRLANVKDAQNIYVLDAGRAVEQGSHANLLEMDGTYAKLWHAQQELECYGLESAPESEVIAHAE